MPGAAAPAAGQETAPQHEEVLTQLTESGKEIMRRAEAAKSDGLADDMAKQFDQMYPGGRPVGQSAAAKVPKREEQAAPPAKETKAPEAAKPKADVKLPVPDKLINPEPEKPATETPDAEFVEATKGMSSKARENFEKVYTRTKAAEKRAAEFESELTKLKAAPKVDNEQLEALKKVNAELDEVVKRKALEDHPQFRRYFDEGKEQLITTAKSIVGEKLGKEVEKLLQNPSDEAFEKLSEEIGSFKAAQVAAVASQITKLDAERTDQLSKWKANSAEIAKRQKAEMQEQQERYAKELASEAEKAIKGAAEEIVFKEAEGETDWNKGVEQRKAEIRRITAAELDSRDRAQLAMQAVAGVKYRELFHAQVDVIRALQSEVKSMKAADPAPRTATGAGGMTPTDENMSYLDRIVKTAQNSGFLEG